MSGFEGQFPFRLSRVEALVFRAPIETPVQTSFGIMTDRPAVLVRVEDSEGCFGWGEVWCNFPGVGAEHRARVFESNVAPFLLSREWSGPREVFEELSKRLRILGIQCGEPGTMAQVIAGVDIALWDMVGKRMKMPLWKLFGGSPEIGVYASGLNPTQPEKLAALKYEEGYRAFKLKIGFGVDRDSANLQGLRRELGAETRVLADANQGWTLEEAKEMSRVLEEFNLFWLEEPIAADSTIDEWKKLSSHSPIPLAAGENLRGAENFREATEAGALSVIQPDLAKWGGFSGCLPVGKAVLEAGRLFCPHWLGSGMGLMASLHLKAALGGNGFVEVDANPNPLRDLLAPAISTLKEGGIQLSDEAGLGVAPDLKRLKSFQVGHRYGVSS